MIFRIRNIRWLLARMHTVHCGYTVADSCAKKNVYAHCSRYLVTYFLSATWRLLSGLIVDFMVTVVSMEFWNCIMTRCSNNSFVYGPIIQAYSQSFIFSPLQLRAYAEGYWQITATHSGHLCVPAGSLLRQPVHIIQIYVRVKQKFVSPAASPLRRPLPATQPLLSGNVPFEFDDRLL